MMVPSGIIRTVSLITVLVASFVQCSRIHEYMTDAEIANVFHSSRQNIPEYDVVMLRHNMYSGRRAGRKLRLQFSAFGLNIDTYLNPSDSFLAGRNTPVWLASTKPNGTIEYKRMRDDIIGIVVGMYCTYTSTDSILAWQRDGQPVAFEGFLNELIIRSLPDRLLTSAKVRRELKFPKTNGTLLVTSHHVIIKSDFLSDENDILKPLETQIASRTRSSNEIDHSQSKRSTKDIVFPSIFIQTDYASSKTAENDFQFYDEIIYQLAFWNAVDLRFRSVSNPKMRLRIAGMILGLDREATPYLNKYRQGDMWVVLPKGFPEIVQYWNDMSWRPDFQRDAYDIVVTLTDNDISFEYNDTRIYRVPGFATTGSLCPPPNKNFEALAVVNDRGGFRGVTPAAHDLGHIMGLTHDKDTDDDCDISLKFIMSPRGPGRNNLRWSRCSLRRLSELMRSNRTNCVDEPAEYHKPGTPVRIILPGTLRNADKQCQGFRYRVACNVGERICTNMKCAYDWEYQNNTELCYDVGPAAEGTACSDGHVCLNGLCQCLTNDCLYD